MASSNKNNQGGPRGNSRRRGAVKKSGKGNPTAGSGGRVKRGLAGKGPTPRAEDRPHHKSYQTADGTKPAARKSGGASRTKQANRPPATAEWVTGRNAVFELLQARVPVAAIRVAEGQVRPGGRQDPISEIYQLASQQGVSVVESSRSDLDRLAAGAAHQGVVAKIEAYRYAQPHELVEAARDTDQHPLIIVLDGVTDPRNLGAIIRSAAAFGAHGVVVPQRRAAHMTAAAWKTSAGAAARVPVAQAVNLTRTLKEYQDAGLMVIGLAADGNIELPQCPVLDGPLVIVIGSEGKGISRLVAQTCDQRVSIPMGSTVESLNASVAAGVALYATAAARS